MIQFALVRFSGELTSEAVGSLGGFGGNCLCALLVDLDQFYMRRGIGTGAQTQVLKFSDRCHLSNWKDTFPISL